MDFELQLTLVNAYGSYSMLASLHACSTWVTSQGPLRKSQKIVKKVPQNIFNKISKNRIGSLLSEQ